MKNPIKFCLLFFLFGFGVVAEDASVVNERSDLAVALLDRDGRPTNVQWMGGTEAVPEFRFQPSVPASYQYQSWALEFSGVATKSGLRISNEGALPDVIRWNGSFENGSSIQLGKRYFYRLLLIVAGDEIVSSPWVSFETVDESAPRAFMNYGKILDLTLSPTFSLQALQIQTKSFSYFTPALEADLGFRVGDSQTAGLRALATADGLFSTPDSSEKMQYSDVALYYRYRWLNGERWNLELGPAVFTSHWSGAGGTAVDAELPRALAGLALTVRGEYLWERWRLEGSLETGYSVFQGKILRGAGGLALFYETGSRLSPGLLARYSLWSGTPADDANDGGNNGLTDVTANVLQTGLVLHVRL